MWEENISQEEHKKFPPKILMWLQKNHKIMFLNYPFPNYQPKIYEKNRLWWDVTYVALHFLILIPSKWSVTFGIQGSILLVAKLPLNCFNRIFRNFAKLSIGYLKIPWCPCGLFKVKIIGNMVALAKKKTTLGRMM